MGIDMDTSTVLAWRRSFLPLGICVRLPALILHPWSARVQVPLPATSQEPTPSEEKHPVRAAIEKREQREVLRQAWAENQTDRLLTQQAEARRDQEFLFKWVGMDKDAGRTDGNMYIWRDEEKALGEGEDDDEAW